VRKCFDALCASHPADNPETTSVGEVEGMGMRMIIWAMLISAGMLPTIAGAQRAHEHGMATLEVTLDGRRLMLRLESPLDNLVGFEAAPRSDKQRAALKTMEERLQAGGRMFKPAPAADCTVREVKVDHPYRAHVAGEPAAQDQGKRPPRDVKGGAAKGEETHTEVQATYELDCAKPEALDRLEVLLFDVFPGVKRLRTQAATPRGQTSRILSARNRTLSF
jgi:Protein of unknown function (DUF2796)